MLRGCLFIALVASSAAAQAETFECAPTLTRVLVRNGDSWKEINSTTSERSVIRELRPDERRSPGKTWGFFLKSATNATAICARYETAITCGVPGNSLDFNARTGRYVRTYFSSFLTRESSEIFVEAGRCAQAGP
ncbi:hypothetical protein [Rhodoplanes sp. Z2-YC6860]|uniref:hypothetical protein n=1 Tax=Rhodoplanes sp. Z2-YC6860 TaxID=674703 RepID=UPI00082A9EDF|nr:hypothetical protein [Rhodoplanes sp. Z2-YC6860]